MANVQETISLPEGSAALAQGVKQLLVAVVANHKALSGSTLAEVSADVTAAVAALGPLLTSAGLIGSEIKADPLGCGEALALGALEAAKSLTGSPSASA